MGTVWWEAAAATWWEAGTGVSLPGGRWGHSLSLAAGPLLALLLLLLHFVQCLKQDFKC